MSMDSDKKMIGSKKFVWVLSLFIVFYWMVHHFFIQKTQTLPTPVVIVSHPKPIKMAEYVIQTGNTVAFNSVDLVARVEGYLNEVKFIDGSSVKKGQELFVIEPEPYLEKLKAAQATVEAQKAAYAYTQAEYARQKQMYRQNATSLNNVEVWLAKSHESEAEVAKAIANQEIATIDYSYTHVKSPFDGRVGRHLVDPGNLVGNGMATDLATVQQIDPIYVYFNLNELDLIKLRKAAQQMGIEPKDINQIAVGVAMQNETGFPHEGKLDFVNTGLNASTGTMEFRALLPNKNHELLPGLFVQVRIAITQPKQKLTVPDTAVQYDQIGAYLLLVDKENKVLLRRIEAGGLEQGMRAVTKGLGEDDLIVVDGLQNAIPGNQVAPQEQASSPHEEA